MHKLKTEFVIQIIGIMILGLMVLSGINIIIMTIGAIVFCAVSIHYTLKGVFKFFDEEIEKDIEILREKYINKEQ